MMLHSQKRFAKYIQVQAGCVLHIKVESVEDQLNKARERQNWQQSQNKKIFLFQTNVYQMIGANSIQQLPGFKGNQSYLFNQTLFGESQNNSQYSLKGNQYSLMSSYNNMNTPNNEYRLSVDNFNKLFNDRQKKQKELSVFQQNDLQSKYTNNKINDVFFNNKQQLKGNFDTFSEQSNEYLNENDQYNYNSNDNSDDDFRSFVNTVNVCKKQSKQSKQNERSQRITKKQVCSHLNKKQEVYNSICMDCGFVIETENYQSNDYTGNKKFFTPIYDTEIREFMKEHNFEENCKSRINQQLEQFEERQRQINKQIKYCSTELSSIQIQKKDTQNMQISQMFYDNCSITEQTQTTKRSDIQNFQSHKKEQLIVKSAKKQMKSLLKQQQQQQYLIQCVESINKLVLQDSINISNMLFKQIKVSGNNHYKIFLFIAKYICEIECIIVTFKELCNLLGFKIEDYSSWLRNGQKMFQEFKFLNQFSLKEDKQVVMILRKQCILDQQKTTNKQIEIEQKLDISNDQQFADSSDKYLDNQQQQLVPNETSFRSQAVLNTLLQRQQSLKGQKQSFNDLVEQSKESTCIDQDEQTLKSINKSTTCIDGLRPSQTQLVLCTDSDRKQDQYQANQVLRNYQFEGLSNTCLFVLLKDRIRFYNLLFKQIEQTKHKFIYMLLKYLDIIYQYQNQQNLSDEQLIELLHMKMTVKSPIWSQFVHSTNKNINTLFVSKFKESMRDLASNANFQKDLLQQIDLVCSLSSSKQQKSQIYDILFQQQSLDTKTQKQHSDINDLIDKDLQNRFTKYSIYLNVLFTIFN